MPYFASNKRFPRAIREDQAQMRENLVLPYLVVNNPGHIVTLCELFDFSLFSDLPMEYNVIGIQCMTEKRLASPPISVFVRSPRGMIELLHHWDISKETNSNSDGWIIHAVVARCVFGQQSHYIDETTRERFEHRHHGEDVTIHSATGDNRKSTHGLMNSVSTEDQLEELEETYDDIVNGTSLPTSWFDENYVQHLGVFVKFAF